jgi:hypothetical protein
MLELVFHGEGGSPAVSVGEAFALLLADGCLSAGGGPVLALIRKENGASAKHP